MRPTMPLAELIYRPGSGQPDQKGRKIPHTLTSAELQSGNESLLEAVGGICVVAQQPVRSLPNSRTMFFDNYLPVNHLQAPLVNFLLCPDFN
jgi:hypothetical protein